MLHEIKVLEINVTWNNAKVMENNFWITEINMKEGVRFQNEGN